MTSPLPQDKTMTKLLENIGLNEEVRFLKTQAGWVCAVKNHKGSFPKVKMDDLFDTPEKALEDRLNRMERK